jgi:hypothetical protein
VPCNTPAVVPVTSAKDPVELGARVGAGEVGVANTAGFSSVVSTIKTVGVASASRGVAVGGTGVAVGGRGVAVGGRGVGLESGAAWPTIGVGLATRLVGLAAMSSGAAWPQLARRKAQATNKIKIEWIEERRLGCLWNMEFSSLRNNHTLIIA